MTENNVEAAPGAAKELMALNPKQESEFKKKVHEAKKNRSKKVRKEEPRHPENIRFISIFPFKRR